MYQLYPALGGHLYIGISNSPRHRFAQHAEDKAWWGQVDMSRTKVTWYATRKKALKVERRMIRRYQPVHNVQHNPRRGDLRPRFGQEGWVVPWSFRWRFLGTVAALVGVGGVLDWWPLPALVFLLVAVISPASMVIASKVC